MGLHLRHDEALKQTRRFPSASIEAASVPDTVPMRLLHLADFGSPYPGSFIPVLMHLLCAARDRGWSGEAVFSESASGRPWLDELDAAGIKWRIAPDVRRRHLAGWVKGLLDEEDTPTILHTHFTRFDIPAALAARRRSDAQVIWHLHSPLPRSLAMRTRNRIKLTTLGRTVAAIVCVAPDVRDQVIRRGAPRAKVHVLPNAIDTDRFPLATAEDRSQARTKLGLPADDTVLLHLGWDWHRKGGDIFLDAVASLRSGMNQRPVVGATVGGEDDENRDWPADIVTLKPTSDVQSLYAAADAFVSPSRSEGQPYAVMEALSCGTPVVASDLPGHAALADGVPGFRIVPGEDAAGVAAAVQSLLARDEPTARAEAAAAHEAIVARFGADAWSNDLLDFYQRLTREARS
jgi:glycosyltransferase involved in cell wall biosynthesis